MKLTISLLLAAGLAASAALPAPVYHGSFAGDISGGTNQNLTTAQAGTLGTNPAVVAQWDPFIKAHAPPQSSGTNAALPVINVRLSPWNAYGDGVHDDSMVIQAALWAAARTNGYPGTVYMPAGDYFLSNGIVLPSNTDSNQWFQLSRKELLWIGDGDSTRLIYTNLTGSAASFTSSVAPSVGAFTNLLCNFHPKNFCLYGPWNTYPVGPSFPAANPSNVACCGISCANTYPVLGGSVGIYWTLENLKIVGFQNGLAISNIDYVLVDQVLSEYNTAHGILFASVTEPHVTRCAVGTVALTTTWTNDVAAVGIYPGANGFNCDGVVIDHTEAGYCARVLYSTNGVPGQPSANIKIDSCASDYCYKAFMEVPSGSSLYAVNNICSSVGTPCFVKLVVPTGGPNLSGFTFGNNSVLSLFIDCDGQIPTRGALPFILRDQLVSNALSEDDGYRYEATGANNAALQYLGRFWATNYIFLPRVGSATRADMESLLGREVMINQIDPSGSVTNNKISQGSTHAVTWIKSGTNDNVSFFYNLKRNTDTEIVAYHAVFENASGSGVNRFNTVVGMTAFDGAYNHDYASKSQQVITTNAYLTVIDGRVWAIYSGDGRTPQTDSPVYSWRSVLTQLQFQIYNLTNDIFLDEFSVEYIQPGGMFTTNSGFRLPRGVQ